MDYVEHNFSLNRSERLTILRGVWDQEYKLKSELTELAGYDEQWAKDERAKIEDKLKQLRILSLKIEG